MMKHFDNREDFRTDEEFANFRNLILANHKSMAFFRSASAVRNKYGRANTVRYLMQKNSIHQIVDFSSIEYRCMSDEFCFILVQKLRTILMKNPPYIIQCDSGKKRTGFVCLILEMLSGTNYNNIVNDLYASITYWTFLNLSLAYLCKLLMVEFVSCCYLYGQNEVF